MSPIDVLRACLAEAGDDFEGGLLATEYILSHDVSNQPRGEDGRWESDNSTAKIGAKYPVANRTVDGRRVVKRDNVDNIGSIESSLDDYDILPGIREVSMSHFPGEWKGILHAVGNRKDEYERTLRLAEKIQSSGKITPLIVVHDDKGPYILEGGHRFDALNHLGARAFPAVVVIDRDSLPRPDDISAALNVTDEGGREHDDKGRFVASKSAMNDALEATKKAHEATRDTDHDFPLKRSKEALKHAKKAHRLFLKDDENETVLQSLWFAAERHEATATAHSSVTYTHDPTDDDLIQAHQQSRDLHNTASDLYHDLYDKEAECRTGKPPAYLSHDIHNLQAQSVLDRAVRAAKKMGAEARADLTAALGNGPADVGQPLLDFIDKYRLRLANLLTATQMTALLEGAREVADKVPQLNHDREAVESLVGEIPLPTFSPDTVSLSIEAARSLAERNVITRAGYDAMDAQARAKAFTVANVDAQATLEKIRDTLAQNVREGADYATFRAAVLDAVDSGTFMSEPHMETVFRTNVQTAFSDGQMTVLQHPLVKSEFPYAKVDAIHDERARAEHLEVEKIGIGGGPIFRVDDPVFQTFRSPWSWNCRCGWTPITVRQAAEAGVSEAREWISTGAPPSQPTHVPMPAFQPPPGFQRDLQSAPLSVQLSLQPMAAFAHDVDNQPRDEDGRWKKGGGSATRKETLKLPFRIEQKIAYARSGDLDATHDDLVDRIEDLKQKLEPHQQEFVDHILGPSQGKGTFLRRLFRGFANFSGMPITSAVQHIYAVHSVAPKLTPTAAQLCRDNIFKVVPVNDSKEATKLWEKLTQSKRPPGGDLMGFYCRRLKYMVVDGLPQETRYTDREIFRRGVWSHELGHAIDGSREEMSRSEEWRNAYDSEINDKSAPLSRYATTHRAEGFAEFCRAVYGTDVPHDKIEQLFPKCAAFFRKNGLL